MCELTITEASSSSVVKQCYEIARDLQPYKALCKAAGRHRPSEQDMRRHPKLFSLRLGQPEEAVILTASIFKRRIAFPIFKSLTVRLSVPFIHFHIFKRFIQGPLR